MHYIDKIDLENISLNMLNLLSYLNGQQIFITGGTGFFGKWLLETIHHLNAYNNLNLKTYVLSRNPGKFLLENPIYNNNMFVFIEGDVTKPIEVFEDFPLIIHAATEASADLNENSPLIMLDTIISGTKNVLELAAKAKTKKLLFVSSGGIYGKQPSEILNLPETYLGAPNPLDLNSSYNEGKRLAEMLCCLYAKRYHFEVKIARCFAFVGPHLPLNIHFAVGNFIRDILADTKIIINGDGTPYRSYMYPTDLITWLFTILLKGANYTAYNVGSDESISIKELALLIAGLTTKQVEIEIKKKPNPNELPARYVPSIEKAKTELGLTNKTTLNSALNKTLNWYKNN